MVHVSCLGKAKNNSPPESNLFRPDIQSKRPLASFYWGTYVGRSHPSNSDQGGSGRSLCNDNSDKRGNRNKGSVRSRPRDSDHKCNMDMGGGKVTLMRNCFYPLQHSEANLYLAEFDVMYQRTQVSITTSTANSMDTNATGDPRMPMPKQTQQKYTYAKNMVQKKSTTEMALSIPGLDGVGIVCPSDPT